MAPIPGMHWEVAGLSGVLLVFLVWKHRDLLVAMCRTVNGFWKWSTFHGMWSS